MMTHGESAARLDEYIDGTLDPTTRAEIEARADDIERMAVVTRAMPPGNSTGMTDEERDLLAAWLASAR